MIRTRIIGCGRAVPDKVLTNDDLAKIVDTNDEWITERTGIKERRILAEEESTSDLAARAARSALEAAETDPADLDAIIVATITPDMPMPAAAVYVQQKIGAGQCPAFDISAACAGFVFGLATADGLLGRGVYRKILLIGVDILSRVTDWSDRTTCVLFGDGAGAVVLTATEDEGSSCILDYKIHSDGSQAAALAIPGGGTRSPTSAGTIERHDHFIKMAGRQVFTHAVRNMSGAALALLEKHGYTPADVSGVFAHQANRRILEGVSQRTRIPFDRFFNNIQKYGNTSAASIPMALAEAVSAGKVNRGDLLVLTALGSGFSWGAALVRW